MRDALTVLCLSLLLSLNPVLGLNPALARSEAGQQAIEPSMVASMVMAESADSFGLDPGDREAQLGATPATAAVIRIGPPAAMDPVLVVVGLLFAGLVLGLGAWGGFEVGKNVRNKDKPGENYAWPGAIIGGLSGGLLLYLLFGCDDCSED